MSVPTYRIKIESLTYPIRGRLSLAKNLKYRFKFKFLLMLMDILLSNMSLERFFQFQKIQLSA